MIIEGQAAVWAIGSGGGYAIARTVMMSSKPMLRRSFNVLR
jgi:ATP-dependent protease HslVU (ClpYQ) peptidase subunit